MRNYIGQPRTLHPKGSVSDDDGQYLLLSAIFEIDDIIHGDISRLYGRERLVGDGIESAGKWRVVEVIEKYCGLGGGRIPPSMGQPSIMVIFTIFQS